MSAATDRYTLQASTFQMAILLQYNTEDSYTVQQLTDSTQIKTVSISEPPRLLRGAASPLTSDLCSVFRTSWFKFFRSC